MQQIAPRLALLLLLGLAGPTVACPASYVLQQGANCRGTALHEKATEVSRAYMVENGVDVDSPIGHIIEPYVVGTTIVDHHEVDNPNWPWGHAIDDRSIESAVADALKCTHHIQHFTEAGGEVARETQTSAGQPPTRLGG